MLVTLWDFANKEVVVVVVGTAAVVFNKEGGRQFRQENVRNTTALCTVTPHSVGRTVLCLCVKKAYVEISLSLPARKYVRSGNDSEPHSETQLEWHSCEQAHFRAHTESIYQYAARD